MYAVTAVAVESGGKGETDEPGLWRRIGRLKREPGKTLRNYISISSLSIVSGGVRSIFTD